ncbi:hypothetical protein [Sphingobacterium hungaricum]|uniref:hypothetical protein n=1 Tax=Sphingobacterium hungaricum TaxID=2082723 RepID=UPI0018CA2DEF|nr:hypothetical protein [Sphingobacterium hungaricum]
MITIESQLEERDKIVKGLALAFERLLESKRANNSELVIIRDGKIVKVKPADFEKYNLK